jgi:dTDP-4-dehydrorhamnose reductase
MKTIVTGMNGTVAPVLAQHLESNGVGVFPWDRSRVSTEDETAMAAFVDEVEPDWFFHVATGSPEWTEAVARLTRERGVRFLFTSSVSVFSDKMQGPFPVDAQPDATDDYGRYKYECEQQVRAANAEAIVARLGWQIGEAPGSNNMVDFIAKAVAEHGHVEAGARWLPSCCFLRDTAEALCALMAQHPPGLYQVEGNPGLSFFEIVSRLNHRHGNPWTVVPTDVPEWDNRMVDPRIRTRSITDTLPPPA